MSLCALGPTINSDFDGRDGVSRPTDRPQERQAGNLHPARRI
jgi:hypothetical protein